MIKLFLIGAIAMLTVTGLQGKAQAGEIYGCYKKNNGQMRIVSSLKKCLKSEKPITLGGSEKSLIRFENLCFTGTQNDYGDTPIGGTPFKLGITVRSIGETDGYDDDFYAVDVVGSVDFPNDEHALLSGAGYITSNSDVIPNMNLYILNFSWTYQGKKGEETGVVRLLYDKGTSQGSLSGNLSSNGNPYLDGSGYLGTKYINTDLVNISCSD
jgi:hypothetical protein